MSPKQIALIANPAAGRGRGARRLAEAERALAAVAPVRVLRTTGPRDEARLARVAADGGADVIAVLGGDGTWGNAAGALVQAGADIPVALLAAGTGNDFVKTLGAPAHDPVATAALIAAGQVRRVDLGCVDDRPFLNAVGFGFDAAVCEAMQRPTVLRGAAVYVATALRLLFAYRGVRIAVDEGPTARRLMLVFANGRWFGGTFAIAPQAALDDGLLDVIGIDDARPWRRAALFARAMRGTHLGAAEVVHARLSAVTLHFTEPPAYEADGEFGRAAGRTVEVATLPRALRVVAPPAPSPAGPR